MRSFFLTFVILFVGVLSPDLKAECPQGKTLLTLVCFHYDPQHPYVDPQDKVLFKRVYAVRPICGSLSGSFFIVTPKETHAKLSAECNAQIPAGHGLLKMRAADKRHDYTISFEHEGREDVFKRIVVFGDSVSEEGRAVKALQKLRHPFTGAMLRGLASLVGTPIPDYFLSYGIAPYWNGMFSNGPMWPRYLAEFLGHVAVDNQAFAGVTTGARKGRTVHLGSALDRHLKANRRPERLAETLYLIWVGANNYFCKMKVPPPHRRERHRVANVAKAMQELEKHVETLFTKGARHIVLFTIPNPRNSPRWVFSDNVSEFDDLKAEWHEGVALHNEELRSRYKNMGAKFGINVLLFDLEELFQSEADGFGLDPNKVLREEGAQYTREELFQMPGYFDPLHPTTKIQCLIAQKLVDFLRGTGLSTKDSQWYHEVPACEETIVRLTSASATALEDL